MKRVVVSAPLFLPLTFTEKFTAGVPVLLAAINRRADVTIESSPERLIPKKPSLLNQVVEFAENELKLTSQLIKLSLKSDELMGNLVAKSAIESSIIGALVYFTKQIWNPYFINQLVYNFEKKQKTPLFELNSTTATFGGFVWGRKELSFLNSVWQLPIILQSSLKHFYLINLEKQQIKLKKTLGSHELNVYSDYVKNLAESFKTGLITMEFKRQRKRLAQYMTIPNSTQLLLENIEKLGGGALVVNNGVHILCYHNDLAHLRKHLPDALINEVVLGEEGVRIESKERVF